MARELEEGARVWIWRRSGGAGREEAKVVKCEVAATRRVWLESR